MADLAPNTPRSDGTPPGAADPELEQLRDLLLRAERRDLARLRSILEDAEAHAEAISRVLPAAVRRSVASGDALMRELEGPVEVVLRESVRRRPEVLTSVIFPVIGPAIRRAASDALARLVRSIDHVLDSALSFRGWRWRLEAWRTGRSYAEIVLRHSLVQVGRRAESG